MRSLTLRRYWFEFDGPDAPSSLNMRRCGVSAYDYKDALALVRERIFANAVLPTITRVIEDVDVSTLDPNHVLPNIGIVVWRGVWFPKWD